MHLQWSLLCSFFVFIFFSLHCSFSQSFCWSWSLDKLTNHDSWNSLESTIFSLRWPFSIDGSSGNVGLPFKIPISPNSAFFPQCHLWIWLKSTYHLVYLLPPWEWPMTCVYSYGSILLYRYSADKFCLPLDFGIFHCVGNWMIHHCPLSLMMSTFSILKIGVLILIDTDLKISLIGRCWNLALLLLGFVE